MADHWRDQLLAALKLKLTEPALDSVAPSNVYTEDECPRDASKSPCINLTVGPSQRKRIGNVNMGPNGIRVQVENVAVVMVEIVGVQDKGLRTLLGTVCKEIEARWLESPASISLDMKGLRDAELVAEPEAEFDRTGDTPVASQTQQYQVTVRSFEGRPDQS